jgi:hypothetical protein
MHTEDGQSNQAASLPARGFFGSRIRFLANSIGHRGGGSGVIVVGYGRTLRLPKAREGETSSSPAISGRFRFAAEHPNRSVGLRIENSSPMYQPLLQVVVSHERSHSPLVSARRNLALPGFGEHFEWAWTTVKDRALASADWSKL